METKLIEEAIRLGRALHPAHAEEAGVFVGPFMGVDASGRDEPKFRAFLSAGSTSLNEHGTGYTAEDALQDLIHELRSKVSARIDVLRTALG